MAAKINARDERPPKPGRKAQPHEIGEVRRRSKLPQFLPDGETPISTDHDQALRDRHEMRKGWFMTEAHRQAPNRARMTKSENFYDGDQWDYREAKDVKDRGQNPVVYNEIKPTIDWLIGMERRARVDFVVMAETDEPEADEDAGNKTKLLKWLDDTNLATFERSWAAEDAFKAGVGWLEVGLRGDESEAPVFVGAVPWRDILWDSQARRRDLSDARYLFRVKVVDLDVAEAIFPDKVEELRKVSQTGDTLQMFAEWMGGMLTGLDQFSQVDDPIDQVASRPIDLFNARKRVLLIECWSREPQRREPNTDGLSDPVTFKVQVSIMTEHDTLIEAWSPFRHNRFPFIPVWGYINRRTGLPYSPIWPLIGPQVSLNHRMSKSLFEASSNQIKIEKGAINAEVMDADEIRAELNAPDGIAVFADGALSGGKVQERPNAGAAQQQLLLAEKDSTVIRSMSGVNADNRGERSNVTSGRAVLAKQDQGSLLTAELFDNLLLARKLEGEITLSVAEQFLVQPMAIRVGTGANPADRVSLNQPQEDGSYLNDITARRAKFVVGEQAWKQAYAEAAFDSLFELLTQLAPAAPQVVVNLLDIIFDMHPNLPKKAAIVARTRQINGQGDPDGRMTPEEQQQRAQKEAQAKQQFDLQMRTLLADVKLKEANGERVTAQAMRERLTTLYESAQAAQVLATVPHTAPIADELARSVGFVDQAGDEPVIDVQQQQQAPQPVQQLPELQQADGATAGIQTPGADGAPPQGAM